MAGDLPWVGAPTSSTWVRVPFTITWPLDREVPSFPIACEVQQSHYSRAEKPSLWCPLPWGGRGPPYLLSGNAKPALTVRREIAIHPSRALFLFTSAEQVALTGGKHAGLRCWDPGRSTGRVLGSKERWPTSSPLTAPPAPRPPVPVISVGGRFRMNPHIKALQVKRFTFYVPTDKTGGYLLLWAGFCSPKIHVQILTASTSECDSTWRQGL